MKFTTTIVCACAVAALAGCADYSEPRRMASIRHSTAAPKPAMSEAEKAQKSIADQCAKRHLDAQNGIFDETEEERRMKDRICGHHYKGS
jgi:Flp pilus assembly protein TadD